MFAKHHSFTPLALIFVWTIVFSIIYMFYKAWYDSIELVSPQASFITPVMASEPVTYSIPCNDVVGYLLCKNISGELTNKQTEIMIAIAKAESNLKEHIKNRKSTATGIFQIVAPTWYLFECQGYVKNWKDNTDCALKIMKTARSGYHQWESYTNGAYKKYYMTIEQLTAKHQLIVK